MREDIMRLIYLAIGCVIAIAPTAPGQTQSGTPPGSPPGQEPAMTPNNGRSTL